MSTVPDVLKSRMMLLQNENPLLTFEDDSMDTELGTRALIRVLHGDEMIALEFVEPEEMWQELDVMEEYTETVEGGLEVTVIVPGDEKEDAEAELGQEGSIRVLGYDEIGSSLRYSQ